MFKIIIGLLLIIWLTQRCQPDCNVCQKNQVACINSTSFYMCFGDGTPHTDQIYSCLAGFQCSDKTAICIQKDAQRPPSCGDTSKCGLCSAHRNYKFACQSRGIFQMCYGAAQPTGPLGDCPKGTVCDATSDAVCVPEQPGQTITCDLNDELVRTTTTMKPSTPNNPTEEPPLNANEVCERRGQVGLFETVPRDPLCKRYISCSSSKGNIKGAEYLCPDSSYFELNMQRCHYKAPLNCIPEA